MPTNQLLDITMKEQQENSTQTAATTFRPPEPPALPTMPRTTNLMGPDSWKREIQDVAGPFGDDRAILGALDVQRRMVEAYEALENIRKTRNPNDTASQHLARAADAYERMAMVSARNSDAALNTIKGRRNEIDLQVEKALGLHNSLDAAEIRQALRGMTQEARGAAIQAAIENKDGAVLQAVFTGREISTGVTDVQRNSFRRRAEQKHCPDLLKLRQGLDKAESLIKGAFNDVENLHSHVGAKPEVASAFAKQMAASDEAWLNFNRTLA